MGYEARVSTANPACILFLIDQSSYMSDPFGSTLPSAPRLDALLGNVESADAEELKRASRSKASFVAAIIDRALNQLIARCRTATGEVRDYFHVGLLGYGNDITPLLKGAVVPISEVIRHPLNMNQTRQAIGPASGSQLQTRPGIWVEPNAFGGTAMRNALLRAANVIGSWLDSHRDCFPPIVVNLSDGEATDGNPLGPASDLKRL
jgi:hypothetical protein